MSLGRLFWKFFSFILLAQVLATIAIGGTFWLKDHARDNAAGTPTIELGPPATFMISAAAATLRYGGPDALRQLDREGKGHHHIYAVDDAGVELLGRPLDRAVLAQARGLLKDHEGRPVVTEVNAPDGRNYLLFLAVDDDFRPGGQGRPPPGGGGPFFRGGKPPSPSDYAWMEVMPVVAAIVASLIFAALLAWYFSKPIRTLRRAFESVARGNLETKVGPDMGQRRDELADLGRDFDSMAGQLHALMDGQRRLLHDVSHELRSPLARMHAAIGLARQQPDKAEASFDRIEREGVRMDKLIDELLTLSRLESGVPLSTTEQIHLDEMLEEIVDNARFEAAGKACTVDLSGDSHVVIKGQPELIYRAVENVVRNAVRHTAPGSKVALHASVDHIDQRLSLTISDQGPGVRDNLLTAIFEPFFRGEPGSAPSGGSGLGLAIARRVAEMHGGAIFASNLAAGGFCVEILLPIQ